MTNLFLLLSIAFSLQPMPTAPPKADVEAISKLAHMAGKWQGDGWFLGAGGVKERFNGGETVTMKLHGRALLVEGLFHSVDDKKAVIHETMGVIIWDDKAKKYTFKTYLFNRPGSGDHVLELIEGGWRWVLETGGGNTMRYTTKMTDTSWHEIGEFIRPGADPLQVFEMNLKKTAK